jgi:hypothetical protein
MRSTIDALPSPYFIRLWQIDFFITWPFELLQGATVCYLNDQKAFAPNPLVAGTSGVEGHQVSASTSYLQ